MKRKWIVKTLTLMLVVTASLIYSQVTHAAGIGFSVQEVMSPHQIDKNAGFIYLQTKPGEDQVIEVDIMSTQEEPLDVKIIPQNAYTQPDGQMGYTEELTDLDETLTNPLTSLLKPEEEVVTLENYETKRVKINLTVPKESYKGVKAGGLTFQRMGSEEEEKAGGVGAVYAMRIGVLTSESGDNYHDSKELKLNEVKPTILRSKKMVIAELQNPESKILSSVKLLGTITDKKNGKVIKKKEIESANMAPNSHFNFEFDWGIERIPSGDFTLTIEGANSEDNWKLTKDFSISGKEAKEINDSSPYQVVTPLWLKITTIVLGTATILVSTLIVMRKKKREKAWKKIRLDSKKSKRKSKGRRRK